VRIVIDTDPAMGSKGGDPEDGFAIMLALNSPELSVEGITIVQGNVPVSHGYPNAVHLLRLMERSEVPVRAGPAQPMGPGRSRQRSSLERRGEAESLVPPAAPEPGDPGAVEFLIQTVLESPGEITLVTIGPLTNVAMAILCEQSFAGAVAGIVSMAGAATVPGNVTPCAEFNVWADPEAADVVFSAGMPMTMVGLDVCEQTHLREETVAPLAEAGGGLGRFVAASVAPWMDLRRRTSGSADLHLYDSLAVAAAFRPDFVECEDAHVAIELEGRLSQGETVTYRDLLLRLSRREANARVALRVDSSAFESFFEQRVIAPIGATEIGTTRLDRSPRLQANRGWPNVMPPGLTVLRCRTP
jgi:inosine-uridine nucleoside N-ribohydrolase